MLNSIWFWRKKHPRIVSQTWVLLLAHWHYESSSSLWSAMLLLEKLMSTLVCHVLLRKTATMPTMKGLSHIRSKHLSWDYRIFFFIHNHKIRKTNTVKIIWNKTQYYIHINIFILFYFYFNTDSSDRQSKV